MKTYKFGDRIAVKRYGELFFVRTILGQGHPNDITEWLFKEDFTCDKIIRFSPSELQAHLILEPKNK